MNIPDCSSIISFNNKMGTCWNLVAKTILFYNEETREQIFKKLLMKHDDSFTYARELVNKAEPNIKYLLPNYFYDDDTEEDAFYDTDFYFRNKNNIITLFATLIERINAKYNNDEYLRIIANESEDDFLKKDKTHLRRELSSMCEDSFTSSFFDIFKLKQEGEFKDYGSTMYETFFILNLLSIVLLDKFYYFEEKDRLTLTIEDSSICYFFWVRGHVVGIFKCDDNSYKYVDNDFIEDFKFKEFICVLSRLETLYNDSEGAYEITYNPFDGIYIRTNTVDYHFCESNTKRTHERGNEREVYKVAKTYEYFGDKRTFNQSNDLVKKLYSPNYRLYIEINKNKIEAIEKLYRNYRRVIEDDFVDIYGDTVFEHVLITKKNEEIMKIIINHLTAYDDALIVLCQEKYRKAEFFKEIVKYIFGRAHINNIKITKLHKLLSEFEFLREPFIEYKLTESKPRFITDENIPKIESIITHVAAVAQAASTQASASAVAPASTQESGVSGVRTARDSGNKYLKYDIFHKKYLKYKQKYLNLKNKLFQ